MVRIFDGQSEYVDSVWSSVAYLVHFDTAPDPRIRFAEKRIRIRPKTEKNINIFIIFFFLYVFKKNTVMLFYELMIL